MISNITEFSDEILIHIFSFLNKPQDIRSLSLTANCLRRIAEDREVWVNVALNAGLRVLPLYTKEKIKTLFRLAIIKKTGGSVLRWFAKTVGIDNKIPQLKRRDKKQQWIFRPIQRLTRMFLSQKEREKVYSVDILDLSHPIMWGYDKHHLIFFVFRVYHAHLNTRSALILHQIPELSCSEEKERWVLDNSFTLFRSNSLLNGDKKKYLKWLIQGIDDDSFTDRLI